MSTYSLISFVLMAQCQYAGRSSRGRYCKKSEGISVTWTDEILDLDCGCYSGFLRCVSQLVQPQKLYMQDLKYTVQVISSIQEESIPAPFRME